MAGVFLALDRPRKKGRSVRGITPLVIGIVLAGVIYSASATAQYGAAAFLYLAFFGIALPVSTYGLGLFLSSCASFLPPNLWGRAIKGGVVLAPIALIAIAHYEAVRLQDERRQLQAEQRTLFEMTSVEGTLAGIPVVLPASPQIDLYHACDETVLQMSRTCRTYFASAVRLRVDDQVDQPIAFKRVFISPTDNSMETWCDRRPDLKARIWCNGRLDHPVLLHSDPRLALPDSGATEIMNSPEDLKVWCQTGSQGSLCHSYFVVAPDVFGRGSFHDVEPSQVVQAAVDVQKITAQIWQDISRVH